MARKPAETSGTWLYMVPITGLELTQAVDEEYRVDRVTFVTVRRLVRVRRRLGLPDRVSAIKSRCSWVAFLDKPEQVVAVVRHSGRPKDLDSRIRRTVAEELELLSLSQLGYVKRRSNALPSAVGAHHTSSQHLCLNTRTLDALGSARLEGKFLALVLDSSWLRFQKKVFFWNLMAILRGDRRVSRGWRETLRRAALLVGQSQTTNDLAHAFLLNMIAIETLLTAPGDKCSEALPARVEAFIGWVGFWKSRDYESRIRAAYGARCKYVHEGDASAIAIPDLLFLDDVVLNLLVNIVGHPMLFKSKADVIEFSRRVAAERTLGIAARKTKVRPKSLRHLERSYSDDDLRRI